MVVVHIVLVMVVHAIWRYYSYNLYTIQSYISITIIYTHGSSVQKKILVYPPSICHSRILFLASHFQGPFWLSLMFDQRIIDCADLLRSAPKYRRVNIVIEDLGTWTYTDGGHIIKGYLRTHLREAIGLSLLP